MTPEQLLETRFKVKQIWPKTDFKVGDRDWPRHNFGVMHPINNRRKWFEIHASLLLPSILDEYNQYLSKK